MSLQAIMQVIAEMRGLQSTKHLTTIPPTIRAYAFGFDKNGSPIYWWVDTANPQTPPTDSDGKPLNPF
jgi:hypothetical protein